jgi:hypothetical protein
MSHLGIITDAPPNSLKYSNASLKVETLKEGVGVRSLAQNTWGGKRGVLEFWDGDYDEWQVGQYGLAQTK